MYEMMWGNDSGWGDGRARPREEKMGSKGRMRSARENRWCCWCWRAARGVGVIGVAVGCKIRMAGRPFGRMTDSTDGRVPVPVTNSAAVPGPGLVVSQGKRWLAPDEASIR